MFTRSRSRFAPTAMLVAVLALIAASCTELEPPEAYTPPTPTSVVEGVEQETGSQVQERPGFGGSEVEFVPTPGPDYKATLLVAGDPFVLAVDDGGSVPLGGSLSEVQARLAVDDLGGGLVVQDPGGAVIYWQAQVPPEILDDVGASLLDVGFWGGSPRAFVKVNETRVDWIQLVSEQAGAERERVTHVELSDGAQIVDFSASRDLQAVIVQDDQCGEIRIYRSDGLVIDRIVPNEDQCTFPGRPAFGAVALSPDGIALAYTIVSYLGDGTEAATEVVARELGADDDYFPGRRIGENIDSVTSLSFDGERVAFLKESLTGPTVTLLELVGDRTEESVSLLESSEVFAVSFARREIVSAGES